MAITFNQVDFSFSPKIINEYMNKLYTQGRTDTLKSTRVSNFSHPWATSKEHAET